MKNIFKIIKQHFILLFGVGLFVFNLFNFSSGKYCETKSGIPIPEIFPGCTNPTTFYYYDSSALILLTIGGILIVVGLLKIYGRKN